MGRSLTVGGGRRVPRRLPHCTPFVYRRIGGSAASTANALGGIMRHTPARIAAVAIAITAIGAPAANAKFIGTGGAGNTPSPDLRSPDARDAALAAKQPPAGTDLRSPDARDAAVVAATSPVRIDLRSPDARDAALAAGSGTSTSPAAVTVQPTVVPVVDHGSQTLAIVLSSTALFLALVAVGFAALYRRPRPRWSAS
jgi:hypothetical protein